MRNILKKTVLATAMAATFASIPAMAADLDFTGAGDGTIVLADVIFGDNNPGTGSEETLIVAPATTFTVDGAALIGDITTVASQPTVKFTLGGAAVFGEDLSTDALVAASNSGLEAFFVNGIAAPLLWTVSQGGAIGDNTITFTLDGIVDGGTVHSVSMQGYKVKNLTSALNPNVRPAIPRVELAVEYVESNDAAVSIAGMAALAANATILNSTNSTTYAVGTLFEDTNSAGDVYLVLSAFTSAAAYNAVAVAASVTAGDIVLATGIVGSVNFDDVATTATDDELTIFGSQPPINLTGTPVVINTAVAGVNGGYIRINVASSERLFTDTDSVTGPTGTDDGRSDFDATDDVATVNLGTFQLALNAISGANYSDAIAGQVKKENGFNFDFNGADDHTLSISSTEGTFQTGASLYLATNATCATPVFTSGAITAAEATAKSVDIPVSGNTIQLTTQYSLCYTVTGAAASKIPEVSGIAGSWTIDYFNTRYDKSVDTNGTYGPLTRNGCVATAFNVPASNNSVDEAIVRLTNTSLTNAGDIRGTLFKQDGTVIGSTVANPTLNSDVLIAPTLDRHATQVFWTKPTLVIDAADTASTVNGQRDLLSIESVFGQENGLTLTAADWGSTGSRARMVMKGAFDTCEAIALLRDKATGRLTNMTATTQANGDNNGNNAQ